ncbi:MAG: hypothetical protein SGPRY_009003, partial [Prymnesium sp.]
ATQRAKLPLTACLPLRPSLSLDGLIDCPPLKATDLEAAEAEALDEALLRSGCAELLGALLHSEVMRRSCAHAATHVPPISYLHHEYRLKSIYHLMCT